MLLNPETTAQIGSLIIVLFFDKKVPKTQGLLKIIKHLSVPQLDN